MVLEQAAFFKGCDLRKDIGGIDFLSANRRRLGSAMNISGDQLHLGVFVSGAGLIIERHPGIERKVPVVFIQHH